MPVFQLTEELVFPHPDLADEDGILAVGGDLSIDRLLLAYCNGIFPWFSEGEPILWWSPDPRFVLFPSDINISKSMNKFLKKSRYRVTFDTSFEKVITLCGELRTEGTWINDEMIEAYCALHRLGFAHSVETWHEDRLVGGLYGVSLGRCFFGESMFSTMDNASKTALITLSQSLLERNFLMIDCQVYSKHLESMGAVNLERKEFLKYLEKSLCYETLRGSWKKFV
ncbi:MAG: leucyl/phenylalanyl-tRNA--protein transferase [Clostridia bacterium]|nr:leucyl/phenylalanyl-tRNA--protein transferase [Clostridia bacterium]